jgi:D-beta-D-heptose 7-phosphate kinase/D-beta-D-heptose 1-phosphate adenosyltransferase
MKERAGKTASKVSGRAALLSWRREQAKEGRKVVFTNGCFDVLHRGHVELLRRARREGDALVVGINSDDSVRRLKGPGRPLVPETDRAEILAALEMVDRVVIFREDTPGRIIDALVPDVLVKGGDYAMNEIVGRDAVERAGGKVVRVRLVPGRSTRGIIDTVLERYRGGRASKRSATPSKSKGKVRA